MRRATIYIDQEEYNYITDTRTHEIGNGEMRLREEGLDLW
jgi:hypothetical protein